jgi:uncharacterized membrane-anchored protein
MSLPVPNNSLSDQALWDLLKLKAIVSQENPPADNDVNRWYIRIVQGFAGWLAACFLVGFIGSAFSFLLFKDENAGIIASLGIAGCVISYFIFKSKRQGDFVQQIGLAFNLCGQLLLAWGLAQFFDFRGVDLYLSIFAFQLVLAFSQDNFIARLLSTWFAMIALFLCLTKLDIANLSSAIAFITFTALWLTDARWKSYRNLWEPIGYGLAITLLMFSGKFFFDDLAEEIIRDNRQQHLSNAIGYWLNQAITYGVFVYLANAIRKTISAPFASKTSIKLALFCLLIIVVSYLVVGVSAAFLLLGVGFLKQNRSLVIGGALSLIGFISWYYYNLSWTLLFKSMVLIGFGLCFAAACYWLHLSATSKPFTWDILKQKYRFNLQSKIIALIVIIILASVNYTIYQREALLENGQIVLLKLAPVDPRSLMQGDYMRLRFAIERTVLDDTKSEDDKLATLLDNMDQGIFIVELDANSVATYKGIYTGESLEAGKIKMQFRIRNNKLRLATHAFFFEEGTGDIYSKAEYGEFRVAENGELLLNSMRDKDFKVLGLNRPEN